MLSNNIFFKGLGFCVGAVGAGLTFSQIGHIAIGSPTGLLTSLVISTVAGGFSRALTCICVDFSGGILEKILPSPSSSSQQHTYSHTCDSRFDDPNFVKNYLKKNEERRISQEVRNRISQEANTAYSQKGSLREQKIEMEREINRLRRIQGNNDRYEKSSEEWGSDKRSLKVLQREINILTGGNGGRR